METVTVGDKKTVVVTVTTCTNGACTPRVTLVVEQLYATTIDGKVEMYTTTRSISVTRGPSKSGSGSGSGSGTRSSSGSSSGSPSASMVPNKSSRLVVLMAYVILLLTSWLAVF